MKPHRSRLLLTAVAAALLFVSAVPTMAEAQRRVRRPAPVVVIGGYGYHHYWLYDPWYQWGPWGPRAYPDFRYDVNASLRIDAEPRQAQVFVDGYYAGLVDEFDGVFQRLRLEPGGHVITLYLEGYRTEQERLYLRPGADQRVRIAMEPLGPGERALPPAPPEEEGEDDVRYGPEQDGRPGLPPPGVRRPMPGDDLRPAATSFGTLTLRVQPSDADVFIDGQRWAGAAESGVFTIELPEGRHRVEVRRPGAATFTEDVLIGRNRTLTLNVSLR